MPVMASIAPDDNKLFDLCDESNLVQSTEKGLKVSQTGNYRMTFTGLLKSTSSSPIKIEIMRVRQSVSIVIGTTEISIVAKLGEPELGISTAVDMLEQLEEDDQIEIIQIQTGSILTSYDMILQILLPLKQPQT